MIIILLYSLAHIGVITAPPVIINSVAAISVIENTYIAAQAKKK